MQAFKNIVRSLVACGAVMASSAANAADEPSNVASAFEAAVDSLFGDTPTELRNLDTRAEGTLWIELQPLAHELASRFESQQIDLLTQAVDAPVKRHDVRHALRKRLAQLTLAHLADRAIVAKAIGTRLVRDGIVDGDLLTALSYASVDVSRRMLMEHLRDLDLEPHHAWHVHIAYVELLAIVGDHASLEELARLERVTDTRELDGYLSKSEAQSDRATVPGTDIDHWPVHVRMARQDLEALLRLSPEAMRERVKWDLWHWRAMHEVHSSSRDPDRGLDLLPARFKARGVEFPCQEIQRMLSEHWYAGRIFNFDSYCLTFLFLEQQKPADTVDELVKLSAFTHTFDRVFDRVGRVDMLKGPLSQALLRENLTPAQQLNLEKAVRTIDEGTH